MRWSPSAARASASSRVLARCRPGRRRRARVRPGRSSTAAGSAGQLGVVGHDQVADRAVPGAARRPRSRCSRPSNSLLAASAPMNPTASTGRFRTTSAGSSSTQRQITASRRSRSSVRDGELDPVGGQVDVAGGERVPHRRLGIPGPVVPVAGAAVQPGHVVGPFVEQAGVQHVGEQVVVPVPAAVGVERDDEQVLPLQGLQHRLPVAAARSPRRTAGPVSRSRTEVSSRNRRTSGGSRSSTSSAR